MHDNDHIDPEPSTAATAVATSRPTPDDGSPQARQGRLTTVRGWLAGLDAAAMAGYLLPFALVLYLGLSEGGFDAVVYSEVGVVVWWGLLVAVLAGVLPRAPLGRAGWIALGLLGAYAAWTALSVSWSESAGRSALEVARVLTYLGVLALALALQGRDGARRGLAGVGAAIAVIGLIALLSRLLPGSFPDSELLEQLPQVRTRLAFPIEYWNGLAALLAIGLPLLLWGASSARASAVRLASAAIAPAIVLTVFLTISRAGAVIAGLAVVALFALYPRRVALLPSLATTAVGGGILIWAAERRSALADNLGDQLARDQGSEVLIATIAVGIGAAAFHYAVGRAVASGRVGFPRVGRRPTAIVTGAVAVVLLAAGLAVAASGELGERFDEFRNPDFPGGTTERFQSAGGNGRWQFWGSAIDAGRGRPLAGIGAGTYELWWQREGEIATFTSEAHSLFLESFGELGVVGFLLIAGFAGLVLVVGARRALAAPPARRAMLAAGTGAAVAFALAAASDWVWEVPVIPVAFLVVAAAVLAPGAEPGRGPNRPPARRARTIAGVTAVAAIAVVGIGVPLLSERALDESARQVEEGDLEGGLEEADRARSWLPFAGEPRLQEALILERDGRLGEAGDATRAAIDREETNWQNWFVLARIEAQRGDLDGAREAFDEARRLNPNGSLLQGRQERRRLERIGPG